MSLFDKIKSVGKMIQEDVKKIPTDDIKERLSDVKNVLSESYSQTKEKLDEKNKLRNLVSEDFNYLKDDLSYSNSLLSTKGFLNYLNPDKLDILEKYKNNEINSYDDILNLPYVKYKGLFVIKPGESLNVLPIKALDVRSVRLNKEVLNFEIEDDDFENNSLNNIETEEINKDTVTSDLIESESETDNNISDDNIKELYTTVTYESNYLKLIDLIWKDILDIREKELLDLNIKHLEAEKLVENCIICGNSNHIDSFVYKENLICSDKCYKEFKSIILTLNNSKKGIESEIVNLNNKLNNYTKNDIKILFNNLKLNELKDNNWIVIPNSFVLKNELSNGETIYVAYEIICKINNDGLLEIIVYRDLLNKLEKIKDFISKDEHYKVLESIFNFE